MENQIEIFNDHMESFMPPHNKYVIYFKFGFNNDFYIDKEKYILSEEKDRANKQIERLLKEISFDCYFNQENNIITDKKLNYTSKCEYTECEYNCKYEPDSEIPQKDLYNLNINYFEKFDINFVLEYLRTLFLNEFIYTLQDIINIIHKIEPNISLETIYSTLDYITKNKITFYDKFNRDGFIYNVSDFYIFNSNDVDIESSIYNKIFNFDVYVNKYTINEYLKNKYNVDKSETKSKKPETIILSDEDLKYNDKIIKNNLIFGTYHTRGTTEQIYGKSDNKFRIVDLRNSQLTNLEDKRKNIFGMWVKSYKKSELIDIINYLKIKSKDDLEDLDKNELANLIENYLIKNKKILK